MDLRKHEQALHHIRSKYAQIPTPSIPTHTNRKDSESTSVKSTDDPSLFQTPIKTSKKMENIIKMKADEPHQVQPIQIIPPAR
jgi:hypothetical protein